MPGLEQVLTAAQMRAAEDAVMATGTSVDELMLRAGQGAAEWVWRLAAGRAVTVLCGPGNNGGDGYVIAETLRARGLAVTVVAPVEPKTDAARNAKAAYRGDYAADGHGGLLVDCLYGSGLTRPLSDADAGLLSRLASRHHHVVAVDLPSGVATDDGALLGQPVRADLTLALGAWKAAHFRMPARASMGEVRLVDIGIAPVEGAAAVFPRPTLERPAADAHKYTRGLLGVVAGDMTGAALLAATAAMRAGAGYVKLLSPRSHPAAPAGLVVDESELEEALDDRRWSALLVGPGLGRSDEARRRLGAVLEIGVPTVLDADALHLLDDEAIEGVDTARLLLTPHEGELDRLCAAFAIEAADKAERARSLAGRTGMTVLAKGPDTVLAGGDGRVAWFHPASSWLSVAGTGDVLAGIAASRLATGRDPFTAAGEAVWLHSEAARLVGPAFTPDDLAAAVSSAYARLL